MATCYYYYYIIRYSITIIVSLSSLPDLLSCHLHHFLFPSCSFLITGAYNLSPLGCLVCLCVMCFSLYGSFAFGDSCFFLAPCV